MLLAREIRTMIQSRAYTSIKRGLVNAYYQYKQVKTLFSMLRFSANLNVQISHLECVLFNKLTTWLHLITHQGGKDFVCRHSILYLYLQ